MKGLNYERHLRRSRISWSNFRLKLCDVASFNRKSGYFSNAIFSEYLVSTQVSLVKLASGAL